MSDNNNLGDPEMITELFDLKGQLADAVRNMRKYGLEASRAEAEYRAKKAETIRRLRNEGLPATLILDLAKGDCAVELYERDMRDVIYETQREYINQLKVQIRVLENQIDREWRG